MPRAVEHLAAVLKEARKSKGLSQTELGKKVGLPQSHISKIERGQTVPKLTSLIELTRMLDLELVLVPRKLLPAVQSTIRYAGGPTVSVTQEGNVRAGLPSAHSHLLDDLSDDDDG